MGKVYLVGAGPGTVDLLTLRAARLLARADVVFHDALVDDEVLALAPQARKVAVGKRCGRLSTAQQFINRQLVDAAQRHACVVRLKGGDPMLFGRAQEEIAALSGAGIEVEVVPGISAAFGASAALGQSLTRRGVSRSVAFLTPAVGQGEQPHAWADAARGADTVVLYMASRQAQAIADGLVAAGLPASRPAVLVENASRPDQRVLPTTVAGLPAAAGELGDGPALILVGEVYAELVQDACRVALQDRGLRAAAA
ncbi:Uroporphyrinogen-III C-methyltransferase [Pigmentiphaga humi]|uniref:uroporphyrinogen-III C-methyltransferase n=1 Tax=Pigmentiphaga humi TaxID=2478468 RepID=A0A3P4B275_9BURK|nr:uroporphyrinogen-III C-methyltransferase [Pigmentiphaga humi]VCU70383.1 Uroporphyrinogen-III C-methyltransferase [Pigmentiphaga humi]